VAVTSRLGAGGAVSNVAVYHVAQDVGPASLGRHDLSGWSPGFGAGWVPESACRSYEVNRHVDMTFTARDRIVLRIVEDFGDASTCGRPLPSRCALAADLVYTLVIPRCEATCTARVEPGPSGLEDVACACP
jgi:hypothetical protein